MPNPIATTRDYLRNAVAELKKVTWPTREMTIRYSVLVIVISLALAAFFAALDFGLRQGVNVVFTRPTAAPVAAPLPDIEPTLIQAEDDQGVIVTPEVETPVQPDPSDGEDLVLPPIEVAE